MAIIKLSSRLEAIAALVPPVGSVADIGTDHGYIPVRLAQTDHRGMLYAADINEAPLQHAKQTALEYDQTDKIEFYLCDGLSALEEKSIETVIIAGMGGENIAEIIAAAPWVKEKSSLLILQPMSKSAYLRQWLNENGFSILTEQLVEDGAIYELLTAQAGKAAPYSPAELLIGRKEQIASSPLYESRLNYLISKYQKAVIGLSSSMRIEDAERLELEQRILTSLLNLKNENT